jgi:uncharacterized protein YecE (DUF72 family)
VAPAPRFPPTEPHRDPRRDALGAALTARFPDVRLGTSSWTFPGWNGIVYAEGTHEKALLRDGLRAYATHPLFRTVGVDRSYYAPLSAEDVADYAACVPADFRPIAKVWRAITATTPVEGGGFPASFLNAPLFLEKAVAPWVGSGLSPVHILEFPPMAPGTMTAGVFAAALERFLGELPRDLALAVELRNEHLFSPRYAAVLREARVGHVYNQWTAMPSVGTQAKRFVPRADAPVVVRLLLPRHARYADKKAEFAPFQRIVEAQPAMRTETVALLRAALAIGATEIFVTVNNKAEGCSPLTVEAIAELLLDDAR